jgi:DNA primase
MPERNLSVTREIKARLSFLELVRRYVELRRVGNRWVAPCPFHQESKPSFSVNEEEGFFYCFGCQAAGDIFDFYGRINGLDFRETLECLAEEAGVSLAASGRPVKDKARDARGIALKLHELAGARFRRNLAGEHGRICREYLDGRALAPAVREAFGLGWSLPAWRDVSAALLREGFAAEAIAASGLAVKNERGDCYDRFRGRLMFPIHDLSGRIIAFGGRIIAQEDSAKYINSPESPLYTKGRHLYGLHQARRGIAAAGSVILTEGYMDVLTLHQFGYDNACAALGTALTAEQVRRLAGFCSRFELVFDGDAPGAKAAFRACEMLLARGLACTAVVLPEGEDIDSLLKTKGKDAFEDARRFAPEGLDYCLRGVSAMAPRDALQWVGSFLGALEMPELIPRFASRLARELDLDERELRALARQKPRRAAGDGRGEGGAAGGGACVPEGRRRAGILRRQRGVPAQAAEGGRPGEASGEFPREGAESEDSGGLAHEGGRGASSLPAQPGADLWNAPGAHERDILKFLVRCPQHLPSLRDAGALHVLTQDWAVALWEKLESCAPDFEPDTVLRRLDDKEKEFWGRFRVMEAPPDTHQWEELADLRALIGRLLADRQAAACVRAMRLTAGDDYDPELLRAVSDAVIRQLTPGSSDG